MSEKRVSKKVRKVLSDPAAGERIKKMFAIGKGGKVVAHGTLYHVKIRPY